ncbi:hypothetical protein BDK51DRAFT_50082 [Blyttiomyces helicus]|uniref:Uncharacterized protein n=1 Tax=Blyttiomyces helicus TaxID=388810 RepID=A0A4P9W763_9FUNG|nr:hypothetical protein BDK51DRAFT_50082 [Blyttiomyces helicus]|eukprot:RKO85986.1 hypothetical protein BDK51DRAFT_50082 [Blyttiomyces helicus]
MSVGELGPGTVVAGRADPAERRPTFTGIGRELIQHHPNDGLFITVHPAALNKGNDDRGNTGIDFGKGEVTGGGLGRSVDGCSVRGVKSSRHRVAVRGSSESIARRGGEGMGGNDYPSAVVPAVPVDRFGLPFARCDEDEGEVVSRTHVIALDVCGKDYARVSGARVSGANPAVGTGRSALDNVKEPIRAAYGGRRRRRLCKSMLPQAGSADSAQMVVLELLGLSVVTLFVQVQA